MAEKTKSDWSSDANDAVTISFFQPGRDAPEEISTFNPIFTYPIFGEEQQIFGYKKLRIGIKFAAHDLYPNLEISYDEKFKPVGDTKALDLQKTLRDFLPAYAFESSSKFSERIQNVDSAASYKPPGDLVHSYRQNDRNYEIWCGELTDPSVKLLLERMQIFISFFVEGGVPLAIDDQEWTMARWRVFFVYERLPSPPVPNASVYSFVGYSTSYRFLTYLPSHKNPTIKSCPFVFPVETPVSVSSLPCRGRISQFLILPPHQRQSHGSHLYNTMVKSFLDDPACIQITVEDPNESFDDLRDYCDYRRLKENGTFEQLKLNTDVDPKLVARRAGVRVPTSKLLDKATFDALRSSNKMAFRQYNRLVELYWLSKIPLYSREAGAARLTQRAKASDPGDRAFYYWRLLVKQRIYRQNKDLLIQLEQAERIEKLEETLQSQLGEYERLLRQLEKGPPIEEASGGAKDRAKRKVIMSDDDYKEDSEGPETKRRKEEQSQMS